MAGVDMATELTPEMEARIAGLAERLGFAGPDAAERVIIAALDYLDESTGKWERWYSEKEVEAINHRYLQDMKRQGYGDGVRPLSLSLQDELYDEFGLPK